MNIITERMARANHLSFQPLPEAVVKIVEFSREALLRSGAYECPIAFDGIRKRLIIEKDGVVYRFVPSERIGMYRLDGKTKIRDRG